MSALFNNSFDVLRDNLGNAIAGGSLTFYLSGTNMLAMVYSDAALTVPLPNPVPVNAAGYPSTTVLGTPVGIFLADTTSYRVIAKNALGVPIGPDLDPVGNAPGQLSGSNGAYLIGYGDTTVGAALDANAAFQANAYLTSSQNLFVYGNSITFGVGASPTSNAWAYRFATELNLGITNGAISGASICDWAPNQFASSVYNDQLTAILPGFNDQLFIGNVSAPKQFTYSKALQAATVAAVVPETGKLWASKLTAVGSWTSLGSGFPGYSRGAVTTTQTTSYYETSVYGSVIYVVMLAQPGCGKCIVTVDGVDSPEFDLNVESENGGSISTIDYIPYLIRLGTTGGGVHLVRVRKSDATGAPVPFLFMAGNGAAASALTTLFLGNTLKFNGNGSVPINYTNYSVAGNNAFCRMAEEAALMIQSDGFDVRLVDASSVYDPFAISPPQTADNVHPNNLGHSLIATAFERAAKGFYRPTGGYIPKSIATVAGTFLVSDAPGSFASYSLTATQDLLGATGTWGFGGTKFAGYRATFYAPTGGGSIYAKGEAVAGSAPIDVHNPATSGDNIFERFYTETSLTLRGSIGYNRGAGLTTFNTTSDYRSKNLHGEYKKGLDTILALKVHLGTMNGTEMKRPMLVAHEAQAVKPEAVTGEKDAVDTDGNAIMQQVDYSAFVPDLIAAIQELAKR